MSEKTERRKLREDAVRAFNELGAELGIDPIAARPEKDALQLFYRKLCEQLPPRTSLTLTSDTAFSWLTVLFT